MKNEKRSIIELEKKIYSVQARMIEIGISKGLTHPDTVKCSQELDHLLNDFEIKRTYHYA
ncbi:hypothetical protein MTP04_13830 [Lysinibacillus sp. PLM2]|nr:hypothetical protein MTP04_13830 [Lysinibacillus sp. PLM2]